MTRPIVRSLMLCAAVAAAATGCGNAGSDFGTDRFAFRAIRIQAYLDRDGTRSFTSADTLFQGAIVSVRPPSGGQPLIASPTDVQGIAQFSEVELGEYSIVVDPSSIGDSIRVEAIDSSRVRITTRDTLTRVVIRLAFPEVSANQARTLPAGKRVIVRGLVLAGVQSFRDTTSHVKDTSGQLRLTRVSLRGGLTGNTPGDSITAVGTVSSRAGQPTIDQAVLTVVGTRPAPVPLSVSTAVAASAQGGTLDAGFVVITGAIISDTATIAPDYRVIGNDGSGPIAVVLDITGGYNRSAFLPGRSMTIRGVLVPDGAGKWQLKPRNTGDVAVF